MGKRVAPCMESVQYVRTIIPLWADGGRLHRSLPFQLVSFSADQGILAQLEWKYMQGKGVFNLILWGRGVLDSITFIFQMMSRLEVNHSRRELVVCLGSI